MQGYFKEPGKTAETLTLDGSLRTGDKGEQDEEGNLRLTGRIKEIFKTSKGKFVAPAPIENRMAVDTRLEQICVVGEGMVQPLAICVLSDAGRSAANGEGRIELESALRALLEQINGELDKHEQLRGIVLVKDVWAVENGYLTPTLKIKRAVIESSYGKHFEDWLQRCDAVLWQE